MPIFNFLYGLILFLSGHMSSINSNFLNNPEIIKLDKLIVESTKGTHIDAYPRENLDKGVGYIVHFLKNNEEYLRYENEAISLSYANLDNIEFRKKLCRIVIAFSILLRASEVLEKNYSQFIIYTIFGNGKEIYHTISEAIHIFELRIFAMADFSANRGRCNRLFNNSQLLSSVLNDQLNHYML